MERFVFDEGLVLVHKRKKKYRLLLFFKSNQMVLGKKIFVLCKKFGLDVKGLVEILMEICVGKLKGLLNSPLNYGIIALPVILRTSVARDVFKLKRF